MRFLRRFIVAIFAKEIFEIVFGPDVRINGRSYREFPPPGVTVTWHSDRNPDDEIVAIVARDILSNGLLRRTIESVEH
jgi:hypothetical protein